MRAISGAAFLILLASAACSENVPAASACRNLTYKQGGLSRTEYLPCVGEMMAALDEVATQSNAAFKGDQGARSNGQASLTKVKALFYAAGDRNLLERWDDRALMNLNVTMNNAVTAYSAFYMVRIQGEGSKFAAETRAAAEAELRNGNRYYDEARRLLGRLR